MLLPQATEDRSSAAAHPFFSVIERHGQLFPSDWLRRPEPPPATSSLCDSSAAEPLDLQGVPTREECRPPFSQAGPRVPGLPLSAPFTSRSRHAGRGRAGGSDSFTAASPTLPFMLDRVKAPGPLQAERQENKIKSPGSAGPPSPGLGDSYK